MPDPGNSNWYQHSSKIAFVVLLAAALCACRSGQPEGNPGPGESNREAGQAREAGQTSAPLPDGKAEQGSASDKGSGSGGDPGDSGGRTSTASNGRDGQTVVLVDGEAPVAKAGDIRGPSLSEFWPVVADDWEVLALSYGESTYPLRLLVRGADEDERHPMGWFVWLVRQQDTLVLVDTGFLSEDKADGWGIREFRTAEEALLDLGVSSTDIDHVVLTHAHWDHVGGLAAFDNATVWLREREFEWMSRRVGDGGARSTSGLRRSDLEVLNRIDEEGRLRLLDEDTVSLLPGVSLHGGGMHTPGSQWLAVSVADETVVLASDSAYLFRNVEEPVAVGTAASSRKNLKAIETMRSVASDISLIVPGHDPAILERYPPVSTTSSIVRIGSE